MNNRINKKSFFSTAALIILFTSMIFGQNTSDKAKPSSDSLSLKNIIQQVISTYPSVKVAEEAIRNADSRIELAKTGYNPIVDLTASFANLAPVTKLSFP